MPATDTSSSFTTFGTRPSRLSFTSPDTTFEQLTGEFRKRGLTYRDFPNFNMYLLKYNRKTADLTDPDTLRCRGLVFDRNTHEIIGTCPEKSQALGDIPTDSVQLQYEEFYDGTNVNVFFANDNWNISTRSCIGAATSFNTDKQL